MVTNTILKTDGWLEEASDLPIYSAQGKSVNQLLHENIQRILLYHELDKFRQPFRVSDSKPQLAVG